MVPCSNHGRIIFTQDVYKGLKSWGTNLNDFNISNDNYINNSINLHKNQKSATLNEFNLSLIYTYNKEKLNNYLTTNFSHNYSRDVMNNLDKIFVLFKAKTVTNIKEIIENKKINDRGCRTAFRVFLNFCEDLINCNRFD